MDQETFAQENGYESYSAMLAASIIIFRNSDCRWLVTPTELGFLAWIDKSLDKPLGYFDTILHARNEIWESRPS